MCKGTEADVLWFLVVLLERGVCVRMCAFEMGKPKNEIGQEMGWITKGPLYVIPRSLAFIQ